MSSEQPQSSSVPAVVAGARSPVADNLAAVLGNRGFVVCVLLLLGAIGSFHLIARATGSSTGIPKEAAWPRKPLRLLDRAKLAPYELMPGGAADIKPEILDALGTREYIQWSLEDTSIPDRTSTERFVHLFVTYYTDDPGQVPHVPEECYQGGGYSQTSEELVEIPVPALGQAVAFKVLTFEGSAFLGRESRVVLYTFHTNGRFAPDRHMVRAILNDPRAKHAYFTKVELSFGSQQAMPSREQAIEAARRFLQKALPVLVNDHWPDWNAVEGKSGEQTKAGT